MMYGPQYFAIDSSKPTISIAATGASYPVNRDKITTTDALQVQWRYCQNQQFPNFQYKATWDCTSVDFFGFNRPVFTDRLCDGKSDCTGGEDESLTNGNCEEFDP